MSDAEAKVEAYIRQVRFRTAWFVLAILVGAVAGGIVHLTGSKFPATDAGILVAGFVFFPIFLWQTSRKNHVSTLEAWRLRAKVKR